MEKNQMPRTFNECLSRLQSLLTLDESNASNQTLMDDELVRLVSYYEEQTGYSWEADDNAQWLTRSNINAWARYYLALPQSAM